ncbi:hypothetical protein Scep_028497 [Stephania cephalantha]|uniref:Protein kinase domain-containing protein n=1 Tax=Stephania cephalantha TaxID=152367 RepID=A0AAP0HNH7_9MAGN
MEVRKWVDLVFVVLFCVLFRGYSAEFVPVDNYLIACGSSQNVSVQGRVFVPDSAQSMFGLKSVEATTTVFSNSKVSVPSPIFQSLRVFSSPFSYNFEIQQKGRHWIRLYFYPLTGSAHDLESAPITVVTEDFVLLSNFTFNKYNGSSLFKEYLINVATESLSITFIPSNNSVTFVNGIEVVSMPDELIPDQAPALVPSGPLNGLSNLAFETVYSSAVNVSVTPSTIKYRVGVTPEIAPNWVYSTAETMGNGNVPDSNFNVTWVFPVDSSFTYFVRLHFCDIVSKTLNTLVFNVYINTNIAIGSLDLSSITGSLAAPYYKDFIANSSMDSNTLSVSVGPDMDADAADAILNGLEIMKISNDARSLDGLSSVDVLHPQTASRKNKTWIIIGLVLGGLVVLLLVGLCYCCLVRRKSKDTNQRQPWLSLPLHGNSLTMTKGSTTSQKSGTASFMSLASSSLGRCFMFQEIMDATNKFDESLLLGVGGFGRVYKGTLEDGTKVAVKRGNPRSEQGMAEFRTEIEMLSKLRHRHLVSLIGYCDERSEMILVYEYMANGPLRSHLYGTDLPPLSWKQRLEIYVKTTNILLDENFVAKVADFGLSKTGPSLDQTHVSTAVKGSFGYLDPEYFRRQQLTEKSDVYSFGVVLMEVLCTRPALNPVLPREQVNIAEWAMSWQKKGQLDQIMDPTLVRKVNPASLKKFGETAENCLAEYGVDRPTMGDVLWNLEYALQLEETSSALSEPDDNSTNHIPGIPMTPLAPFDNSISMIEGVTSGTDDDGEDAATSAVFSQLMNPRGR